MKKFSVLTSCLYAFVLNGMDQSQGFSIRVNGTMVCVSQKSIIDMDGKVDVLVTSFDKQLSLRGDKYRGFSIGDIRRVRGNMLTTEHKYNIDMTEEKKMNNVALLVVEPMHNKYDDNQKEQHERLIQNLVVCYDNVLSKIPEAVEEFKANRTIAISPIGSFVGFACTDIAPVALKTTIDFVQKHPKVYETIYLLAENPSDVSVYRKWVMNMLLYKKSEI